MFVALWLLLVSIVPLVAGQLSDLATRIQGLIRNLVNGEETAQWPLVNVVKESLRTFVNDLDTQILIENASSSLSNISNSLGDIAGNVWELMKLLFNGIFNFIFVLFLTYFMAVDSRDIEEFIKSLFPSRHGQYIAEKSSTETGG